MVSDGSTFLRPLYNTHPEEVCGAQELLTHMHRVAQHYKVLAGSGVVHQYAIAAYTASWSAYVPFDVCDS